jgi:hypothetical protein
MAAIGGGARQAIEIIREIKGLAIKAMGVYRQ